MASPSALLRPQVLVLLLSLALCRPAHSFWFTSGRAKSQAPQWFGIRDYGAAAQAAYSYDSAGGVTVAVPVAVPLAPHQLQASPPYPGLSTVQLVPCLCPISKDPEGVKPMPPAGAAAPPPPMAHPMQSMAMQPVAAAAAAQHQQHQAAQHQAAQHQAAQQQAAQLSQHLSQ